jgi:ABC-type dipeptide/oligopeptide/nickel transport system ATPase component
VRDLSVDFTTQGRTTNAVKRVSFSIGKGETVALVGESGSGKTVSALSILKLLPYPSASHPSGEIYFEGRNLLNTPEAEMRAIRGDRISIIFQEPMTSLNPLHTIEKQVGEILRVHRGFDREKARERTLELLHKVGIREPERRLGAYPHQLSGGQRQRIMIAMALANEPELLIADEPTTALDVTIQAQILELLKELQSELGMAMLLITHDLGIVRKMAERVYVMKDGEIVEQGPMEKVFDTPEHPYTSHLLNAEPKGEPPTLDDSPANGRGDRRPQGLVSDQEGVHAADRGSREGGRRCVDHPARRPDRRRRRRIRFWQDDARPRNPAVDLVKGPDRLSRPRSRWAELQSDAPTAPRNADRIPGPLRRAFAPTVGDADHRGGASDPETLASITKPAAIASRARLKTSASTPTPWTAIRTNFPADSVSASRSPARWSSSRASSCSMSRPVRWT